MGTGFDGCEVSRHSVLPFDAASVGLERSLAGSRPRSGVRGDCARRRNEPDGAATPGLRCASLCLQTSPLAAEPQSSADLAIEGRGMAIQAIASDDDVPQTGWQASEQGVESAMHSIRFPNLFRAWGRSTCFSKRWKNKLRHLGRSIEPCVSLDGAPHPALDRGPGVGGEGETT